jgi:ABC-type antimicrobial peptide transport system permease subunit
LIPLQIFELVEYEIRSIPRSLTITGEFKYNVIVSNEVVDRKMLKRNKKIFDLYTSMTGKETEKIKNPLLKYLVFALIVAGFFGWKFYDTFLTKGKKQAQQKQEQELISKESEVKKDGTRNRDQSYSVDNGNISRFVLSYYVDDRKLKLVDPVTGIIYLAKDFPYKIKYHKNDRSYTITTNLDYRTVAELNRRTEERHQNRYQYKEGTPFRSEPLQSESIEKGQMNMEVYN